MLHHEKCTSLVVRFGTGVSHQEWYHCASTISLISKPIPRQLLPVSKEESPFEVTPAEEVKEAMSKELEEITGKGLQECLQQQYNSWQRCVILERNYDKSSVQ
jgi:hypothetical protein